MAVPKRRVSKTKVRQRSAARNATPVAVSTCEQCGASKQPHRVCPSCGYYRGRQVKTVEAD